MTWAEVSKRVGWAARRGVMPYPTMHEIDSAALREDAVQLLTWLRFLPSPGQAHIRKSHEEFQRWLAEEGRKMDWIVHNVNELRGTLDDACGDCSL